MTEKLSVNNEELGLKIYSYSNGIVSTQYKGILPNGSFLITHGPTANCQIYSIGCADNIIPQNNAIEIFKAIQKLIMKPQVLIDIKSNISNNLEKIFTEEDIVFKQPYVSTNGSDMIMYLIKTANILKK